MNFIVKHRYKFLTIQFIIFICMIGMIIYRAKNPDIITVSPDMLVSEYVDYENGEYYFDERLVECSEEEEKEVLSSRDIPLRSGSYTLYIDYESNADKRFGIFDGTINKAYIPYNNGYLKHENNLEMFKFKTPVDLDSFSVKFFYQPYGYLKIRNISIASNTESLKSLFLFVFVLFLCTDICFVERDKVLNTKI